MGMLTRKSWDQFRDKGLLWWTNRILHLFGYALVAEMNEDGSVKEVYPARCKFRGFSQDVEEEGFVRLTKYLSDEMPELKKEANE